MGWSNTRMHIGADVSGTRDVNSTDNELHKRLLSHVIHYLFKVYVHLV